MKNIIIEVPRNGASAHLLLRGGASSGQAVIVASDEVEIRLSHTRVSLDDISTIAFKHHGPCRSQQIEALAPESIQK